MQIKFTFIVTDYISEFMLLAVKMLWMSPYYERCYKICLHIMSSVCNVKWEKKSNNTYCQDFTNENP